METESKLNPTSIISISIIFGSVLIGGSILFAANMIAGPVSANTIKSQGTSQTASGTQGQPSAQTADISKVKIADEPFIGNPNAPVTIAYWFDYQCPFCKRNEQDTIPQLVKEYVDTGKVKLVFKDFQFLGADSQTLGQFARAVWATTPDKFYQWHKAVYDNAGTENTGWATHDKIMSITSSVLGTSLANQVAGLVTSQGANYQKEMDADKAEGSAFGVSGTPSLIVGKQLVVGAVPYSQIKAAIDFVLNGK